MEFDAVDAVARGVVRPQPWTVPVRIVRQRQHLAARQRAIGADLARERVASLAPQRLAQRDVVAPEIALAEGWRLVSDFVGAATLHPRAPGCRGGSLWRAARILCAPRPADIAMHAPDHEFDPDDQYASGFDAEMEVDEEAGTEALVWQLLLLINPGDEETALRQFGAWQDATADLDDRETEPAWVLKDIIDWTSGFQVHDDDAAAFVESITELVARWNLDLDWGVEDPTDDAFLDDASIQGDAQPESALSCSHFRPPAIHGRLWASPLRPHRAPRRAHRGCADSRPWMAGGRQWEQDAEMPGEHTPCVRDGPRTPPRSRLASRPNPQASLAAADADPTSPQPARPRASSPHLGENP